MSVVDLVRYCGYQGGVSFFSLFFFFVWNRRWDIGGIEVKKADVQMEHGVHLWIFHLLADVGADDVNFLLGISQLAGEQGVGEGFETFHDLEVVPRSDFFLFLTRTKKS